MAENPTFTDKGGSGRIIKVYINGLKVVATVTQGYSFARENVDITTTTSGGWIETLGVPASQQVTIDLAGVAQPDNFAKLKQWSQSHTHLDVVYHHVDGVTTESGKFIMNSLALVGEPGDAVRFTASLASSGAVTSTGLANTIFVYNSMQKIAFPTLFGGFQILSSGTDKTKGIDDPTALSAAVAINLFGNSVARNGDGAEIPQDDTDFLKGVEASAAGTVKPYVTAWFSNEAWFYFRVTGNNRTAMTGLTSSAYSFAVVSEGYLLKEFPANMLDSAKISGVRGKPRCQFRWEIK